MADAPTLSPEATPDAPPDATPEADPLAPLAWDGDALEIPTQADPIRIRWNFGNLKRHDRAQPASLLSLVYSFGPVEAAGFLRYFAEDEAGRPLYASDEEGWEGVQAATFVRVQEAYLLVYNLLTEKMGFTSGAEGKG